MHHNAIRRRRGETRRQCEERVQKATAPLDVEHFQGRALLFLYYGKGRSAETVADCLDMTVDDCHELRRRALTCL